MSNVVRHGNFILPLENILFGKDRVSVERRHEIEQPFFLFLCFSLWLASLFSNGEFSHGKIQTGFFGCAVYQNRIIPLATSYTATLSIMEYQQLPQEVDAYYRGASSKCPPLGKRKIGDK